MKIDILTVFCWGIYRLSEDRRNRKVLYTTFFFSGKNKTHVNTDYLHYLFIFLPEYEKEVYFKLILCSILK